MLVEERRQWQAVDATLRGIWQALFQVQAFRRSGVQAFRSGRDRPVVVGPKRLNARTPERLNAQDHRFAAVPPERLPQGA